MVATSHALRLIGLPALELWSVLLPYGSYMWFLEDNQAMLQCIRTGRNPTMRHLARTHRVSVAWIHEQYAAKRFTFAHESGEKMPPDIFTKAFQDRTKWKRARHLINIVLPEELAASIQIHNEIHDGIREMTALPAALAGGDQKVGVFRKIDL